MIRFEFKDLLQFVIQFNPCNSGVQRLIKHSDLYMDYLSQGAPKTHSRVFYDFDWLTDELNELPRRTQGRFLHFNDDFYDALEDCVFDNSAQRLEVLIARYFLDPYTPLERFSKAELKALEAPVNWASRRRVWFGYELLRYDLSDDRYELLTKTGERIPCSRLLTLSGRELMNSRFFVAKSSKERK